MDRPSKKRTLRNDLLLIAALLAVAAVIGAYLLFFRSSGDLVKVTVEGKEYATYSLNENLTVDILTGKESKQLNRLVIKDGKAHIETATCPDGICAAHSAIFRDGESIICLPHEVVVTVVATPSEDAPDAVG